ncbi:fibronectin type III domain-containing protein [Nonomuraea sp. LPB2021202275-12-8]|uniref:fibronectin type III domain-containing protein n=1 Tax=Nonomuraea sp. LPB2021202275-12-8 TaxID=3120159 RepID=UPI00300C3AC2
MDLRLVAHAPNGDRLGSIPQPLSLEAAWPLNDVGGLRLAYAAGAVGAELLEQPCEVAIEWSADGVTWTEPPDGRFLRILRRGDSTDQAEVVRYELPAFVWMLRKLILYSGSAPLVDGKRAFLSATPGAILRTWLTEGQTRGALPGVTWDFTLTHDSAGVEWAKVLTIYYEPGLDLLTTLINLAEQGVIDFQMQGRELRVFNADTLHNDLAAGDAPVDLRYGRDITQAPEVGTLEDAASAVLVVGDAGFQQSYVSSAGHGPWGRWEMFIGQGGVSDPGTATLLADTAIKRASGERVQRTRSIALETARWLPFRDYAPGDLVLAPGEAAAMQSLRVRQITLTRDHKRALAGHLVLNDRLLERDLRLARRTAGIVGGSTSSGGSGAKPAPEAPAPRTPTAPPGLIVDSAAFIDTSGYARGQITATWGAVTQDVVGVALDISGYELYGRKNEVGLPWLLLAVTPADDTTATYSPLPVGETWAFKVRAVNNGRRGGFSAPPVVEAIADDPDAPPVPTTPLLATRLGVVHVSWDGLGAGAEPMPTDLARVRVWMQDPLAPGWEEIGYLDAAGSIVVPGLPYGADRDFRFTAVDHSGNESAASPSATIATVPLVDGDAAEGSITTGALAANAVTAAKVAAGAIEASHIAAEAVTADKLQAVLALATRIVAGDPGAARVELNEDGLEAYDSGGAQTVTVSAASGAVSIVGQLSTGVVGRRIIVNPAGSADPEIRWYPSTGTNYARIFVDNDGSIIHISGLNSGGDRRSQVIQRGDEWRMHIYNPSTALASGGYMFAQPTQLEVGYNDPTPALNRWRFTSTVAEYKGRLDYFGGDAGLLMFSLSINLNSGLSTIAWGSATMLTTPFCAIGLTYSGTGVVTSYMTARSTSGFNLRCDSSGAVGSATAMIWAWRK